MQDGYFQVIAEPVSTWVHEIFERGAAAVAALGDEIVDAALALGVAGVPVLHRRIFDLGVVERDQLDHRGVKLVLVALGRRAAFEIADVGALVGDDQRALELAGVLLVDAEIGRQLHRAAHARRHVDERAVGEHRRIQRRVEIVGRRHDRAEILAHQLAVLAHRLGERAEDHPRLGELGLEGGGDRDRVEHRVDRDLRPLDAGEDFLFDQAECRAWRRCAAARDRPRRATSAPPTTSAPSNSRGPGNRSRGYSTRAQRGVSIVSQRR